MGSHGRLIYDRFDRERPGLTSPPTVTAGSCYSRVVFNVPTQIGYSVLAGLIFGESAGLPIPGETALIAAGLMSGIGQLNITLVIAVATGAAILGDNLGFWLGRRGGRRALLAERGPFRRHRQQLLERGEVFFARYGVTAVFVSRWIAGIRPVAAVVAGATGMPAGRFFIANGLGAIAWAATTALLVFWLGTLGAVIALVSGLVLAGAVAAGAALVSWRARRHDVAATQMRVSA